MPLDTVRVVQAVTKPRGALTIQVDVVFYDSADPPASFTIPAVFADAKTLHTHTFQFDPSTTGADALATIRSEGAAARAAIARAATIAASNPVGQTYTVP